MNKAEEFLKSNPGYFKWGKNKLANYLGVSLEEVISAESNLKSEKTPLVAKSVKHLHVNIPGVHLIFPDLHVPGHNKKLINATLKLAKDLNNVVGLHLIGDFLDMNSLSSHD